MIASLSAWRSNGVALGVWAGTLKPDDALRACGVLACVGEGKQMGRGRRTTKHRNLQTEGRRSSRGVSE